MLYRVGVESLPIVATTALFAGAIAVVQTGANVVKFRAYEVVGWAFGFSVFREIGPLLVGLMFSGRVGANNTAQLSTMQVTEQVDALRALAIDPIEYLVLPRVLSMVLMMTTLAVIGNAFALVGGIATSWGMLGVDPWVFWNSFAEYVTLTDFANGVVKAAAFGLLAISICAYQGFHADRNESAVGARAVSASTTRAVVLSSIAVLVADYIISSFFV